MDSNQTSQPTPTPEQKGGYNMAYVIVGVFSLIVLAAVAVPFTLNVFKGGQDQTLVDKQEVAEDTKSLNAYRDGTSAEAAKAYVDGVDARIQAGNISDAARDLLLLRKAGVMSTARGDAETIKSNAKVATQLFRDFINRSNPNTSDLYFRDFSIVALTRLNMQCCSVSYEIMDGSIPLFNTFERYTSMGYSKSLAALLALDDATTQLSEARKPDIMNRLNSVDIAAKILIGFKDELNAETKSRLLQELSGAINEFSSLRPLTFTEPNVIMYEGGNKMALAYDLYKSNQPDGTSASVNAAIDRQYEDAADAIRAQMKAAADIHGLNEVLFYNQINYLESIDRRYGDAVNMKKHNDAIDTILEILKTEPTITNIGLLYFPGAAEWKKTNPDEMKKLSAYTHFMDLSKENADIAAYLKSINVTW